MNDNQRKPSNGRRRVSRTLAILPAAAVCQSVRAATNAFPPIKEGYDVQFPRDHGAHPDYRTEWWYLTAWLNTDRGPAGLQLTFFRSRTRHGRDNPSRLAAKQLLFAHAALALPGRNSLIHAQQAARLLPGRLGLQDTFIRMGSAAQPWEMKRTTDDQYTISINDDKFSVSGTLKPPGPPVLQGNNGFSRKGNLKHQASYYYSRPQLQLSGEVRTRDFQSKVTGTGWLDHEWSSEILDSNAVGWDWVGLNLDNTDALMAFRIRARDGSTQYAHARWMKNNRPGQAEMPEFKVLREWRSARTGIRYPVQMQITVGNWTARLEPLFDDQEMDTRITTGILYWEGAVRVYQGNRQIGRGYLELTGYGDKVRL